MNKPNPLSFRILTCLGSVALAALLLMALHAGLVSAQGGGPLTRVTLAEDVSPISCFPKISADGTKILFDNGADVFGECNDTNQFATWLYDTSTLTLTRLISDSDLLAFESDISGDGTKIAYVKVASAYEADIWLYDLSTMKHTRITTATDTDRDSYRPKLNYDGTKIVFVSNSDFLNQGIPASQYELWLYDTTTQTLTRLTTSSPGSGNGAGNGGYALDISDDGTKIAFASNVDLLNGGTIRYPIEVWLYDTVAMTYTRLTSGTDASREVAPELSISRDGTKIAFGGDVDYFGQGIPDGSWQIWLYDTEAMTLTRITTASDSSRLSFHPSLNSDGSRIAFVSNADFLNQGNIQFNESEIWLYDTMTMTYTRITTSPGRTSLTPVISADGSAIAFMSNADFFDQGDIGELQKEIWLYEFPVIEPPPSPTPIPQQRVYLPLVLK